MMEKQARRERWPRGAIRLLGIELNLDRLFCLFRARLKLPMSYRRHSALSQKWMSAHDVDLLDRAVGLDLSQELYRSANIHGTGKGWIYGWGLNQDFSGASA
jgi:hypothetical protein